MTSFDVLLTPGRERRKVEAGLLRLTLDAHAIVAVLVAFLTTRLLLGLVIFMTSQIPMRQGTFLYAFPENVLWDGLIRFDSWWYHDIINHGYRLGDVATGEQGTVAFFPLYPLTVKVVAGVVGNDFVAGLLVSNLSFLVALTYIYRWARREFDDQIAGRTVFYLASAPTAIFFSAMYTESLFVLLVAATFFYASESKWTRAAIAGALAAATRNTGVLMAAVIALEGWHQSSVHFWLRSYHPAAWLRHLRTQIRPMLRARRSLIAAAIVPTGLLAYMVYLAAAFDDPLAFIHAQETWGRETSAGGVTKIVGHTHELLRIGPQPWLGQINVTTLMDLVLTLAFLPLVAMVVIRMRPAYVVFTLATFLVPLSTGSVGSMSRYVLMLLPCYLLLACWGRRQWVDRVVVISFLPLLAYFAILFSHWYVAG